MAIICPELAPDETLLNRERIDRRISDKGIRAAKEGEKKVKKSDRKARCRR